MPRTKIFSPISTLSAIGYGSGKRRASNSPSIIKKPTSEFLGRYFKGEGYKDGIHGLALAGLQAFSEMVLYLKVWQADKFGEASPDLSEIKKEFQSAEKEVNWWLIHTTEKGIVGKVKKKLLKR